MSDPNWERQLDTEEHKLGGELTKFMDTIHSSSDLTLIYKTVLRSAADKSLDAGYGGRHDDGGARQSIREFRTFLEGVQFGNGGDAGSYQHIIKQHRLEQDPEYKEYQRLQAKFGDKKK